MAILRSLSLCALTGALIAAGVCPAQTAATAIAIPNRVVNPIDESQLVTLGGTIHPLANVRNDRGVAADSLQLGRMHLVLKRSAAQEAALQQLIGEMHTPGSANYHKWLTPDQFGAQFGPSDQDIATVTTWLNSHGFSVSKVNPGKQTIEFTGNAAQLRSAFHTQIHKYMVDGETHYANASAPQIPSALATVVSGFASLNNFRPRSYAQKLGKATFDPTTHQLSQWTWGTSSSEYFVLAPGDFAKQYDLTPLYTANINGAGQTIAIVNDSNINIDLVNQFRTLFSLPANPPQIIVDGNDPGIDGTNNPDGPNGDSVEAYLDVEWAGAVAPAATIDLVVAADTSLETGLILAAEHAVYGNIAPIVSVSFGSCESNLGSGNAFLNSLWEQAAAQGQTVMVSTGDNGSAGCDNDNTQEYAIDGQAVNGFASTPYNVAVGGTDFYYSQYNSGSTSLNAQLATYWNTSPTQLPSTSLLNSVVPEQPWNASQYGLNTVNQYKSNGTTSIAGGSGGASNCATLNSSSACAGGYAKPAWQKLTLNGTQYVPSDSVRDLPDVSLFASSGSNYTFYPICATDGDCQTSSGSNPVQIYGVGGTSASAPAFAGIMALVLQSTGSRQGQADTILYPLKAQYPSAFHDVTNGTNSVPCAGGSPNCISVSNPITLGTITEGQIGTGTTPEYNAGVGYNLATGLGTIDAYNLVTNWNKVALASTTTAMTITPPSGVSLTSIPHGTGLSIAGTVTGSGNPTGNVALMTDSTEPLEQGQGAFTLSSGSYSGSSINYLPGGTYNVWTQYGGDGANGMSTSTKTQITVTPETPGMNLNLFNAALGNYYTSTSSPGTQVDYGTQLMVSAMVAPSSQLSNLQSCTISRTNCSSLSYTQPTGTVTFTDGSNTINTAVINAEGDAEYNAPFAIGSHSVSAKYNGDQSYNTVTASSPITFTVVKDQPVAGINASNITSQGVILNGQPTVLNVLVENSAQYGVYNSTSGYSIAPVPVLPPTGTVTVSSSPAGISGTATLSAGVDPSDGAQIAIGVFTLPATLAANTYNVTLTYSGDSNYSGGSYSLGSVSVASTGLQPSTTTANASANNVSPIAAITVTGTVTGQNGHGAPTGSIILFSSGNQIGAVTLTAGAGTASTFAVTLNSQTLFQGANFVTLQYTGDNTYAPSEFTLNNSGPISNPLADFSMTANSTIVPISIANGANYATDTINLASVNGFGGNVNLTCAAASPVTCSIASPVTLSNQSSTTAAATINVPAGAANNGYNVLITATDAATGQFVHTLGITTQVTGSSLGFNLTNSGNISVAQGATSGNTSTVTVTPVNGFTGTVNLSCAVTTSPSGASTPITCGTSNLSPQSVTISGTTALTSTLTINTSSTTTPGSYAVTVTGTAGSVTATTVVNVTVNGTTDFSLTNSGNITVYTGATTNDTATITVTPTGGFSGTVALTCTATLVGASTPLACSASNFNPSSVTISGAAQTSTFTASTTSSTSQGTYTVTVTGTSSNGTQHTTQFTVSVNPPFKITATSSGNSYSPGQTITSNITVTPAGGFTGTVNLSCAVTSAPSGATSPISCSASSLSPASVTISGANGQPSTLTITTTAATAYNRPLKLFLPAGGGAVLAIAFFFVPRRRRNWLAMFGLLVLIVSGLAIGCGGGGNTGSGGGGSTPSNGGTTAGTYTVTITGTSGSTTSTATLSLTVL